MIIETVPCRYCNEDIGLDEKYWDEDSVKKEGKYVACDSCLEEMGIN